MKISYKVSDNIESKNKTALLFAPNFFRLQKSIVDGFEKNDIGTYLFLDKPSDSVVLKSKLRLNPKYVKRKMTRYLKKVCDVCHSNNISPDFIVVFEGQAFLEQHVAYLKEKFHSSYMIIYCWDSIERFPYIEHNLKHFDRIVTFSYDNYKKYKFDRFVPLFIPEDFYGIKVKENEPKYDLCFIGTGHPPKISFLSTIESFAKEKKLSFYESIFLPSHTSYFYYKLTSKTFKKRKKKQFCFKGKNAIEIQNLYSISKAVVDAGNPNESGVSLRIFECLSMQKKVILANKSIVNYPFYDPNRFLVFPDEKDRLLDFLKSPYPELSAEEMFGLSTKQWIKKIVL